MSQPNDPKTLPLPTDESHDQNKTNIRTRWSAFFWGSFFLFLVNWGYLFRDVVVKGPQIIQFPIRQNEVALDETTQTDPSSFGEKDEQLESNDTSHTAHNKGGPLNTKELNAIAIILLFTLLIATLRLYVGLTLVELHPGFQNSVVSDLSRRRQLLEFVLRFALILLLYLVFLFLRSGFLVHYWLAIHGFLYVLWDIVIGLNTFWKTREYRIILLADFMFCLESLALFAVAMWTVLPLLSVLLIAVMGGGFLFAFVAEIALVYGTMLKDVARLQYFSQPDVR